MIFSKIYRFVFGSYEIEISKNDAEITANYSLKKEFVKYEMKKKKNDGILLKIRACDRSKMLGLLDKNGIKVYSIKGKGLPLLLHRYSKRYGLIFGFFLFLFLIDLSGRYVWNIDVSGNENIREEQIISEFENYGFSIGTNINKTDLYELCNKVLKESQNYSWVSVNIDGTTAHIEVRERLIRNQNEQISASNLVAKFGGVIKNSTVSSGKSVFENEQTVAKGDLLVSGILEKQSGFEIVRSVGNVYAEVTKEFEVFQPYLIEKELYGNNFQEKLCIEIFGKRFTLKDKLADDFQSYDDFFERERVMLFDKIKLPLYIERTVRKEKYKEEYTIDENEAEIKANEKMTKLLSTELKNDDVLYKETNFEKNDSGVIMKVSVRCISDIAEEKIIETSPKG